MSTTFKNNPIVSVLFVWPKSPGEMKLAEDNNKRVIYGCSNSHFTPSLRDLGIYSNRRQANANGLFEQAEYKVSCRNSASFRSQRVFGYFLLFKK